MRWIDSDYLSSFAIFPSNKSSILYNEKGTTIYKMIVVFIISLKYAHNSIVDF